MTNKVCDKLYKGWEVNLKELEKIGKTEVPRQVDDEELLGFSDVSEKGYGAFIYVRSVLETGNLQVRLLTFKSRMAPLNEITLSSLELFGVFVSYTFNQRRKNCPQKKN